MRPLDIKNTNLNSISPSHGAGFFSNSWRATAPLPPHRVRDRDRAARSQLARSFDRFTRKGLRLIKGGKDPVGIAKEHSPQIAEAAPDAAVADVLDAAIMILIIAAGRNAAAIDTLPAWAFAVLAAVGIVDTFPGAPLSACNAAVNICVHCAKGVEAGPLVEAPTIAGKTVLVHERCYAILLDRTRKQQAQQSASLTPPVAKPQPQPKPNGHGNAHAEPISWNDAMRSPADIEVVQIDAASPPKPRAQPQQKAETKEPEPKADPAIGYDQRTCMQRMVENGYSVTLCLDKGPRYSGWQKRRHLTFEQLVGLQKECEKRPEWGGHHARLGAHNDDMPCIDVDITIPEACEEVWMEIQDFFGRGELLKRVGKAPKFVVPLRLDGKPFKRHSVVFSFPNGSEGEIDLRCQCNQTVCSASTPTPIVSMIG